VKGPVFLCLSVDVDTIEQMFEYSSMSPALIVDQHEPTRADVEALRHRIAAMENTTATPRVFPVHDALTSLFPQGGLLTGAVYSLDSSASLLWSLLAEPTQKGTWCAVVGMPDLGLAAAEELGVNVDRLVLVPSPGAQWMAVVGTLLDVVGVCALGSFPRRVSVRSPLCMDVYERGSPRFWCDRDGPVWMPLSRRSIDGRGSALVEVCSRSTQCALARLLDQGTPHGCATWSLTTQVCAKHPRSLR
jgi:hypothetical protein